MSFGLWKQIKYIESLLFHISAKDSQRLGGNLQSKIRTSDNTSRANVPDTEHIDMGEGIKRLGVSNVSVFKVTSMVEFFVFF